MSDCVQAGAATDPRVLRDYIMNPCVAKSEPEWWAARRIEALETALRRINERLSPQADRTFDGLIADSGWCAAESRRVAAPEPAGDEPQSPSKGQADTGPENMGGV